jgi:hypothetical protein
MGSFAEEREIESLKRKWRIAEVVDFEEIERANGFSLSLATKNVTEDTGNNVIRKAQAGHAISSSSVTGRLTLTTLFKMKMEKREFQGKETQESRKTFRIRNVDKKLTLSSLFKKKS